MCNKIVACCLLYCGLNVPFLIFFLYSEKYLLKSTNRTKVCFHSCVTTCLGQLMKFMNIEKSNDYYVFHKPNYILANDSEV